MVKILFGLPWTFFFFVGDKSSCVRFTNGGKLAPIIFFFSAQKDKSKRDPGESLA